MSPHPPFQFVLMVKPMEILSHQRGSIKRTLYHFYLFLLCAEEFTSLLSKTEVDRRLHGVNICRRVPSISNLLFVDDSLIFCQANQREVQVISDTL